MSRIGKMPITLPAGVTATATAENVVVKGPKGTLELNLTPSVSVEVKDNEIIVSRKSDSKLDKTMHGTTRANLNNMVHGVSTGFTKELEINGVGYRAQKQGKQLVLNLGYSHQVIFEEGNGITLEVPSANKVVVCGADKQAVGQFAAEIREKRLPEPYKGKGIKYVDEVIIRKQGKTGKK